MEAIAESTTTRPKEGHTMEECLAEAGVRYDPSMDKDSTLYKGDVNTIALGEGVWDDGIYPRRFRRSNGYPNPFNRNYPNPFNSSESDIVAGGYPNPFNGIYFKVMACDNYPNPFNSSDLAVSCETRPICLN